MKAAGIDPASVRKRTTWNKEKIVAALRARRNKGLLLYANAIGQSDSSLYKAIWRWFGSHDAALRAAGIDPASARKKPLWDKERVVAGLRARRDAGQALHLWGIQKESAPLYRAIRRLFGSHDAALRAAGLDPASIRKRVPNWDKTAIVAALKKRRAAGTAMNARAVFDWQGSFYNAAVAQFGSYDAALRAAGVDPQAIHIQCDWDRDKVVAALLKRKSKGLPLNLAAIAKSDTALAQAAPRYFGSHDAALEAAGIDPATVRKAFPWSKAQVVAALRARRDAGQSLKFKLIHEEHRQLAGAATSYFGDYEAALRAAGIDPRTAGARVKRWNKPRILAELRDRRAKGLPLNVGAIQRWASGLGHGMVRQFGSHGAALRAAGIDPGLVRRRAPNWTQDAVMQALRERHAGGLAMNMRAIARSQPKLSDAIRGQFDSHDAALRAVGIEPVAVRRTMLWSEERILEVLRDRRDKGLPMNAGAVGKCNESFFRAVMRRFGSYDAALRAVGIDPSSVRKKGAFPDDKAVFAALRAIARDGSLSCGMVRAADIRLLHVSRRRFASFPAAVEAAGLRYFREGGGHSGVRPGGHWNEMTVLKALREMHAEGNDLRYRHIKTHYQSLFFAAKEHFGSYVNAVREAGIDYWRMSQAQLAKERGNGKHGA